MDDSDHDDLTTMMNSVDKNDIREEMSVLWEQQIKMSKRARFNACGWHQRYLYLYVK